MHIHRRTARAVAIAASGVLVVAAGCMPAPGTTTRITVSSSGGEATTGASLGPLSGSGRFAVFASNGNDLAPGDAPRAQAWDDTDVFVRDISAGTTELISTTPAGTSGDHRSWPAAISDDGRYVLFTSEATNLTADPDDGGAPDVFLRDRQAGTTTLLSGGADGGPSPEAASAVALSDDGRVVLLDIGDPTVADGLVGPAVLDRTTGAFEAVPLAPTMEDASWLGSPVLSGDGGTVAYRGLVLDTHDASSVFHQFIWDRASGTTQQISPPELATSAMASPAQFDPVVSDDGDVVLWGREHDDAPCCDERIDDEVFAWHRSTGSVMAVTPGDPVIGGTVRLSGNGRWAVATSGVDRHELVRWGLDGLASGRIPGVGATGPEAFPTSLSDDGRYVGLTTAAPLVTEDANGSPDGYLWVQPD